MKRQLFIQWLKIFLLIVAGGIILGLLSNSLFNTPAYAKLAADQNQTGVKTYVVREPTR